MKNKGIFLIAAGILVLTSCIGAREQGKDTPFSTVRTDNYNAVINTDGTLSITDKAGAAVLDSSPRFYFDYGDRSFSDVSLFNPSFEWDSNLDGIPDGWTVDKVYIRQSDERVSDGKKSLKFNMTAADNKTRRSYSPPVEIKEGSSYSIDIDACVKTFASGSAAVQIYYYTSADGTGAARSAGVSATVPTANTGAWTTISLDWDPPFDARSFKVLLYSDQTTAAAIYFDNLRVRKATKNYQSNGDNIVMDAAASGDGVTITAADDTNAAITVAHKYELNTHSPDIKYTATLIYKKDVMVREERFDFAVPAFPASIMNRDLRLNKFDRKKEYYSDLFTPRVIRFDNGLSFPGDDTMQSMRVSANGSSSRCSFYSDYELNHPFKYFIKNGGGATTDISSQSRRIGDNYTASLTFSVSAGTAPGVLVKTRQPDGYEAVLVLTNQADSERTATVNAVAYGTEDKTDPDYGTRGIVGRGLGWTKSVFAAWQNAPYGDLNDPAFKSLHDQLRRDGAEIIGNTITAATDSRAEVENGLQRLSHYGARNWIDANAANGADNWEDIASQGTLKANDNYILDLLDSQGYEYAWSYIDVATRGYELNMLKPSDNGTNTSFFYYNNRIDDDPSDSAKIYLWSTLSTKKKPELYYTAANVDSLISQRGVHIGHEYMASAASENHTWYVNPANGKIEITPAFDGELAYIASKRDAGLLWTPNMAQFADYLKLQQNVQISNLSGGDYRVINNNRAPIKGLTLLAEKDAESVRLNGKEISLSGGSYKGNKVILPALSPGRTALLSISYRALP